ncbi:MAG: AI-2E family transporter [Methanotrichaceae archaeon]
MEASRKFDIAAVAIVFLVFIATVYLTKDFLSTILLSIVMTFLLKPVYARLFRLTRQRQISSFLAILVVFIIILAVLLGMTSVLLIEISNLQRSGDIADISVSNLSQDFNKWMEINLPEPISGYVKEIGDIPAAIASWALPIIEAQLSGFASNLPILFAQLIVVVFFTYYILIDGRYFVRKAIEILPKTKIGLVSHFLQELNAIYTTLFTVYFTTSILSGILAALGFFLLGIPYPLIWGVIVAIFTLIPLLGPPFVIAPIAIYYLLLKDYLTAFSLVIFGVVALVIIPENILRPQLAIRSARIHPIITVLAYTAPVFVVGLIGVIIGPALYGFLLAVYRTIVYYREI